MPGHYSTKLLNIVLFDFYNSLCLRVFHISNDAKCWFLKAELKKANVKVFQMHSKGKSMILQVTPPQQEVCCLWSICIKFPFMRCLKIVF